MTGLTIAMTTWAPADDEGAQRAAVARVALRSWRERLEFDGPVTVHVADDGSALPGYPDGLYSVLADCGWGVESSRAERHGVGASLNRAFRAGFSRGDLVLYVVDDWMLPRALDLNPWAVHLAEREDVGMIRLFPHVDTTGRVEMLPGDQAGHALRLDRHHYAFSHRPALYHRRMIDAYGWFAEDVNAYDCERLYNERFQQMSGPDVLVALPHQWVHLGGTEFAGVDPSEGVPR